MPDLFRDFTPEELNKFGVECLEKSRQNVPEHFKPSGKMLEGYQYLSGEIEDKSKLHYQTYCNELYDAWKGWAPKFCSRPPNFMVRPGAAEGQPLASTCQSLFRYRTQRFDYQEMILKCCQDAVILGVAYARHQWDEQRGLTVTSRFRPQDVFWDATAKTIASARHVVEKHTLPRWQFAKKFGDEVAWDVNAAECKGDVGYWPESSKHLRDGKSPLDPIEYYLLWSTHGDHRRVYAFHEDWKDDYLQPESREANENLGEEWPFDFDEGEWHLTPLIPTILNDRIEGIAVWEVVRGQYIAYQNLLGASIKYALQTCKKPILVPTQLDGIMRKVEQTGETVFTVPYNSDVLEMFNGRKIEELITVLDLGQVSPDLLREVQYHQQRFQQLMGSSAVNAIQPGGVETAAEATKLADAAANRVADDQGAVERFVNKIGRKELTSDLRRMPAKSVLKVTTGGDEEYEAQGEIPDEKGGPRYLRNVPYMDAIKLEKGPASDEAALRMEAAREKKRNEAWVGKVTGDPQFQEMQPEEAEESVPVTPEVEVRRRYGVPVLAEVEICNPGVEQFVSEAEAVNWPPRPLSRREVEKMFSVSIEQGTASSNGRMQAVQEILMIGKQVLPEYKELGLDKQYAAYLNAIILRAELWVLNDCIVTEQEVAEARKAIQEAQAQMAQAEAAAKNQPQGPVPVDPNVQMKTQAEIGKGQIGLATQQEKTKQQEMKLQGDAIRERSQNIAQQQMGAINRLNGVA